MEKNMSFNELRKTFFGKEKIVTGRDDRLVLVKPLEVWQLIAARFFL